MYAISKERGREDDVRKMVKSAWSKWREPVRYQYMNACEIENQDIQNISETYYEIKFRDMAHTQD